MNLVQTFLYTLFSLTHKYLPYTGAISTIISSILSEFDGLIVVFFFGIMGGCTVIGIGLFFLLKRKNEKEMNKEKAIKKERVEK